MWIFYMKQYKFRILFNDGPRRVALLDKISSLSTFECFYWCLTVFQFLFSILNTYIDGHLLQL